MEKTIDVIVDGGKASAGPPLGPALGPMGVNAGQVVAKINEETKNFSGMKVPVKVIVDTTTKEFRIEVGAPPTAELIKKEAGIEKGAGNREAPAGDVKLEALVNIAKSKSNSLGKTLKDTLKEVVGSCVSLGVNIDGKDPKTVLAEIDSGSHDSLLGG
jgi:large subunit ribosomal protein L11